MCRQKYLNVKNSKVVKYPVLSRLEASLADFHLEIFY